MKKYSNQFFRTLVLFVIVSLGSPACNQQIYSKKNQLQAKKSHSIDNDKQILNPDFAFKLFTITDSISEAENSCLSPLSIALALGMSYNGAQATTAREIGAVLGIHNWNRKEYNSAVENYLDSLDQLDQEVEFEIGNSIWLRNNFPIAEDFLQLNQKYFHAEVMNLGFGDPHSADKINNWVAQATRDKIKTIVQPPLSPEIIMLLINAIYFQADWTNQFKPRNTNKGIFYAPHKEVKCEMMQQEAKFKYGATPIGQIIDLPYGQGQYAMTILLPSKSLQTDSLIAQMTKEKWQNMQDSMEMRKVQLFLPKYKIEYKQSLNDVLNIMGIEKAFDPQESNFAGISPKFSKAIYIDEILHKTYLQVDEKGTEAAAVTSIKMGVTAAYPPEKPVVMRINRPFLFTIRALRSGDIIFIGKLTRP